MKIRIDMKKLRNAADLRDILSQSINRYTERERAYFAAIDAERAARTRSQSWNPLKRFFYRVPSRIRLAVAKRRIRTQGPYGLHIE